MYSELGNFDYAGSKSLKANVLTLKDETKTVYCFDIALSFQKDKYEYWKQSPTVKPSLEGLMHVFHNHPKSGVRE